MWPAEGTILTLGSLRRPVKIPDLEIVPLMKRSEDSPISPYILKFVSDIVVLPLPMASKSGLGVDP